jgi:putative copper resistance protein D
MTPNAHTRINCFVTWSAFFFFLLLNPYVVATYAQETASQHNHDNHNDHDQHTEHNHNSPTGNDTSAPHAPEHQAIVLTPPGAHDGGHHPHRPPLLPPDQDRAYSELNHHIAGVFVLFAGGFALLAAFDAGRFSWARYGWPWLFFALGVFLVFRHDPESWPHGPLSLQESLSDPQIVQHVIFTFIILGIGLIEWLRYRGTLSHPIWGLVFPALAVSAAFMLFAHKHGEGESADKIYRHHVIMAVAGILAMIAKVLDDTQVVKGRIGGYVWTGLMIFIGLMLLIYSE